MPKGSDGRWSWIMPDETRDQRGAWLLTTFQCGTDGIADPGR